MKIPNVSQEKIYKCLIKVALPEKKVNKLKSDKKDRKE